METAIAKITVRGGWQLLLGSSTNLTFHQRTSAVGAS
jgi:hypothetical protein